MLLACLYEVKKSEFIRQIVKLRSEVELKRIVVEKGLGAEEIERILAASGKHKEEPDEA